MTTTKNPHLQPAVTLLAKIGSIVVHADELLSTNGHAYDRVALQGLLNDPEVTAWVKAMREFLPVKRPRA